MGIVGLFAGDWSWEERMGLMPISKKVGNCEKSSIDDLCSCGAIWVKSEDVLYGTRKMWGWEEDWINSGTLDKMKTCSYKLILLSLNNKSPLRTRSIWCWGAVIRIAFWKL